MEETTIQNTNQQPTTQPADNGNQGGERLFSQTEVNQIIKDRLARERAKAAPPEPTEAEKKESELTARESRLNCRAYLLDNGYPSELLDVLDTSDLTTFKKAADTVSGLMKAQTPRYIGGLKSESGIFDTSNTGFEAGRKHTPKPYPPRYNE